MWSRWPKPALFSTPCDFIIKSRWTLSHLGVVSLQAIYFPLKLNFWAKSKITYRIQSYSNCLAMEVSPTEEFRCRGRWWGGHRKKKVSAQLGSVSKLCHQAARRHKGCSWSATKLSSEFNNANGSPKNRDLSSKLVLAFTFHSTSTMVMRMWILPNLAVPMTAKTGNCRSGLCTIGTYHTAVLEPTCWPCH